jgi:hypothetical protein
VNKTKKWRFLRLALAALGLSTLMADGGLREDEIDCEQAVAYLQQCCPEFSQNETLQCEYSDGCGVTQPALSIPESQCILGETCAQLVANGICTRALHLASPSTSIFVGAGGSAGTGNGNGGGGGAGGGSSTGSSTPSMVCP